MATMLAVMKTRPEPGVDIREVPLPEPGDGEVRVRVQRSSICGTDVHIYRFDPWSREHIHPPLIIGHETAGVVEAVGRGVKNVKEGDRVAVETHIFCGSCRMCLLGEFHLCEHLQTIGIDRDGAYAEYLVIPAVNAWKIPDDLPFDIATLMEPFGNAVYTVEEAHVEGKSVLITGAGPIGLMGLLVARALGASRIAVAEPQPLRARFARELGADLVVDPTRAESREILRDFFSGAADVHLEFSGAPAAFDLGLQMLRNGGTVSLLGLAGRTFTYDWDTFILKGLRAVGIHGRRIFRTWVRAQELISSGKVDLSPLITHRLPLEDIESGFAAILQGDAVKVVVIPPGAA